MKIIKAEIKPILSIFQKEQLKVEVNILPDIKDFKNN